MANINYLTEFMPSKWHQGRRANQSRSLVDNDRMSFTALEKGSWGEMQSAAWINYITDESNVLYNNILVPNDKSVTGNTELDLVWVSSQGIIVVEVKSYSGELEIYNDRHWKAFAPDSNKNWEVNNPTSQCIQQATVLRKYLRSQGLILPIQSVIFLPAANAIRICDNTRMPLICNRIELIDYLNNKKSNHKVSPGTLEILVVTLNELGRA